MRRTIVADLRLASLAVLVSGSLAGAAEAFAASHAGIAALMRREAGDPSDDLESQELSKCGIDYPCRECTHQPGSICTINKSEPGLTMCKPICGQPDAHTRLMSIHDSFQVCMIGRSVREVQYYFEEICSNYSVLWPRTSVLPPETSGCTLDVSAITGSNYGFRKLINVSNGEVIKASCQDGLVPSNEQLTCALGALFPADFTCGERPCAAPEVMNGNPGGACKEGMSVPSRSWCTPHCATGFAPGWRPSEVKPTGGNVCNLSTRPSKETSLCCNDGTLPSPMFMCYESMQAPSRMRRVLSKQLHGMASNVVATGMKLLSKEMLDFQPAENVTISSDPDGGMHTDFQGFAFTYSVKARMAHPLPNSSRGRGMFRVNVTGDLKIFWSNKEMLCNPKRVKCSITMTHFRKKPADGSEIIEPLPKVKMDQLPWMKKFEKACGRKLCERLSGWASGAYAADVVDKTQMVSYECTGWDPGLVMVVPIMVMPFLTIAFMALSPKLLLEVWQRKELKRLADENKASASGDTSAKAGAGAADGSAAAPSAGAAEDGGAAG